MRNYQLPKQLPYAVATACLTCAGRMQQSKESRGTSGDTHTKSQDPATGPHHATPHHARRRQIVHHGSTPRHAAPRSTTLTHVASKHNPPVQHHGQYLAYVGLRRRRKRPCRQDGRRWSCKQSLWHASTCLALHTGDMVLPAVAAT